MRITSTSPGMTQQIAAALARRVRAGDLLALTGPLGAGKTCFTQGLARGLGIGQVVASPSFVLARHYPGSPGLLHVDAYRLSSAEEFWDLGLQEPLESSVSAVEWASNIEPALPEDRLDVEFQDAGGEVRVIEFRPHTPRWREVLAWLARELAPMVESSA